jgi:hypothetical protein
MPWGDDRCELIVPYDLAQRELYEADDPRSIFYRERWPTELRSGRQRSGRFPEIAARASFRALGFSVLISEPRMPDQEGFILAHYAGMRERHHPAYTRMFEHFPLDQLEKFNCIADAEKIAATGNRAGGDPDLFVFRHAGERFFVEVKDRDRLGKKQIATFPLIESILRCEVKLARLRPVVGARPGDLELKHRS